MPKTNITGTPQRQPITGTKISLVAPGYTGTVETMSRDAGGRSGGDKLDLEAAAAHADANIVSRVDVDLKPARAAEGGRGAAPAEPVLVLPADEDREYAVLQTDDNGISRWVLGQKNAAGETRIKLPPGEAVKAGEEARGEITKAMRSLVRVVSWAVGPLIERGALAIARSWEGKRRPYGLLQVTPAGEFVEPRWPELSGGPTLLLVHGTFSTPDAGFKGWVGEESFRELAKRYGSRCLALAHPSLSAGPDANIEWLLQQLPETMRGPLDIVCHSRGGLVSRVIASHEALQVRRVVQVGVPNGGTPLADEEHMIDFLDGHTTLLTRLPDTVATIVLEGVLCVVKLVAKGAQGLPGLSAMQPQGDYLSGLGKRALRAQQWFTIGADYRAGDQDDSAVSAFTRRLADKVVDRIFLQSNDLVVPSDGCHLPGVAPAESLRLSGARVHHTNYFADPRVHERLNHWLQ